MVYGYRLVNFLAPTLPTALRDADHALELAQPGAEDGDVKRFIEENEWLQERTVYGGPCVLVLGDKLRSEAANPKL